MECHGICQPHCRQALLRSSSWATHASCKLFFLFYFDSFVLLDFYFFYFVGFFFREKERKKNMNFSGYQDGGNLEGVWERKEYDQSILYEN